MCVLCHLALVQNFAIVVKNDVAFPVESGLFFHTVSSKILRTLLLD